MPAKSNQNPRRPSATRGQSAAVNDSPPTLSGARLEALCAELLRPVEPPTDGTLLGRHVTLVGLTRRPELNGRCGVVRSFHPSGIAPGLGFGSPQPTHASLPSGSPSGRWEVGVEGEEGELMRIHVKPENLQPQPLEPLSPWAALASHGGGADAVAVAEL